MLKAILLRHSVSPSVGQRVWHPVSGVFWLASLLTVPRYASWPSVAALIEVPMESVYMPGILEPKVEVQNRF